MAKKATTTTSDPELSTSLGSGNEVNANAPTTSPARENVRGEVPGCPTNLTAHPQAQQPQRPGGGGAASTGQPPAQWSEEAKNQQKTSRKSRAESGTTALRKV
jgi:hypothetical protein